MNIAVLLVALVHSVVVVGIVAGMALGILAGVRHLRLFRVACVGACFSFEVALDVLLGSRSVRILGLRPRVGAREVSSTLDRQKKGAGAKREKQHKPNI